MKEATTLFLKLEDKDSVRMVPEKLHIKEEDNQENIMMSDNRDSSQGSVDYSMRSHQSKVTDTQQGIIPRPESQHNSGKKQYIFFFF